MKVNLFIVGVPKSGTTSLHTYLAQHPDIFMSRYKEPHFFCKDLHEINDRFSDNPGIFTVRDMEEYMNLFSDVGNESVIGESSTLYMLSATSANEIFDYNNDAKILMMIREPVSFMYSLYLHNRANLDEREVSFERALSKESERLRHEGIDRMVDLPEKLCYRKMAHFSEQVQRYLEVFEKQNIKIVLFEEFVRVTEKVYNEILDFLEVDSHFEPEFVTLNRSRIVRDTRLHTFTVSLTDALSRSRIKKMLPLEVRRSIGESIKSLSLSNKRKDIDSKTRIQLMGEFKKEVERLNDTLKQNGLIKEDLVKVWGYDRI